MARRLRRTRLRICPESYGRAISHECVIRAQSASKAVALGGVLELDGPQKAYGIMLENLLHIYCAWKMAFQKGRKGYAKGRRSVVGFTVERRNLPGEIVVFCCQDVDLFIHVQAL